MKSILFHNALLLAVVAMLGATASCGRSEPSAHQPEIRELRIFYPYADGAERDPFARPEPSLYDILQQVWQATEDENVRGLLLRVGSLGSSWGSIGDLIEAFAGFREPGEAEADGRPIYCHFESADNVAYLLLASSCDRISMTPAGVLDLVGPSAVMIYARSFLEKIGVQAEILHMGRYKGAGDMFIRDDMPPEAKESMDAILDSFYTSLTEATAKRVEDDQDKARALIDGGPYVSTAALEAGLVDAVAFAREAREEMREQVGVPQVTPVRIAPRPQRLTLGEFFELFSGREEKPRESGDRVALVFVTGNIIDSERTSIGDAASGPFVRTMQRLERDPGVKAVVLRINSPGGSALASDRMWEAARRVAKEKPVIASVGDVAASGGYYIASAADAIFAHPDSIVGSIGVVGGKFNIEGLAKDLGVHPFVLQRGEHAAWSTPVRALTPGERRVFESLLRDTYERFIDRVAEGREMKRERVLAAAEGRVLTARDARERGLIDNMAGLGDALAEARSQGGLGKDSKVEIWPAPKGMLDAINELLGDGNEEEIDLEVARWLRRQAGRVTGLPIESWRDAMMLLGDERVALLPPVFFSIR